ncbi:MAG: tRNA (adenosine(37)-N6)-threonylcarbamoyltransferase complex transferase subunit TsaD [Bacteroidales bacterium]|nr:tRNA (adenosine(37)-N6)-threonylcarbamoyltransferase complex transferase subunit TsaD [Bacteroidales bacterium]
MPVIILGIESSCDDTAAAVVKDGVLLSNIVADQEVHRKYGGVVPELASRAHQQNIVPVVDQALKMAGIKSRDLSAVAFTRGPGLLGSLLVGSSFAKGFALAGDIPLVEVNHLQAHILVHFLKQPDRDVSMPLFPFLCLLVSGGHTQLIVVRDYLDLEIIGTTIDDAAGEAFDKSAKVIGLPYPGGPMVDRYARDGNADAFAFTKPVIKELDYSFSGLKTAFLYFIRDRLKENKDFIKQNRNDLCASIQKTIVEILTDKLEKAFLQTGIREIALAGGVSANSGLRERIKWLAQKHGWNVFIPEISLSTDNAAMIAMTGYFKFLAGEFAGLDISSLARLPI